MRIRIVDEALERRTGVPSFFPPVNELYPFNICNVCPNGNSAAPAKEFNHRKSDDGEHRGGPLGGAYGFLVFRVLDTIPDGGRPQVGEAAQCSRDGGRGGGYDAGGEVHDPSEHRQLRGGKSVPASSEPHSS